MPQANAILIPTTAPGDVAGLEAAIADGRLDPATILAVWCKTEGNGLANDHTRDYADLVIRTSLARRLNGAPADIAERVQIIVSGGAEGVVSPHMVVVHRAPGAHPGGLRAALVSRAIPAADLGREAHAEATAAMVRDAAAGIGLSPDAVALATVKTPTPDLAFPTLVRARVAAAVGVAVACDGAAATLDAEGDGTHRAFVVARPGDIRQQVLVLGNGSARHGDGEVRIASGPLAGPLDAPGVAAVLAMLGIEARPQACAADSGRVLAMLAKGDAPRGSVRGWRHTMHDDPTLPMHRQARAVYGTLVAAAAGVPACFASGGAERHGPGGGGSLAVIAKTQSRGD